MVASLPHRLDRPDTHVGGGGGVYLKLLSLVTSFNLCFLQDTVVALQALAKYGAATYSAEGNTTVTVMSLGGLNKQFTVDQMNRLLYQEERLSEVPGEYMIKAQGQSCILAQVNHVKLGCVTQAKLGLLTQHIIYPHPGRHRRAVNSGIPVLSLYTK